MRAQCSCLVTCDNLDSLVDHTRVGHYEPGLGLAMWGRLIVLDAQTVLASAPCLVDHGVAGVHRIRIRSNEIRQTATWAFAATRDCAYQPTI